MPERVTRGDCPAPGRQPPRPFGWVAYGRGTAAGRPPGPAGPPVSALTHPVRPATAPNWPAVLHAPGILSPGKLTLKGATCHELRHTCLTRLREAGMALAAAGG
jgi:hypothetical protein